MKSPCTLRTLSLVFRLWLVPSGWAYTSEPLAPLLAALPALLLIRWELLNILSANQQFIHALLPSLYASPLSSLRYVISSRPLSIFRINTEKVAKASLRIWPCPLVCIALHDPGHFVEHLEKIAIFLV